MQAAHDESVWEAFIELIFELFQGVAGFLKTTTKLSQLLEEFVVVELQKLIQMVFSLLRRSGRAEEVGKFNSWPSQFGVLKVNNDHISGINAVFIGVPRITNKKNSRQLFSPKTFKLLLLLI